MQGSLSNFVKLHLADTRNVGEIRASMPRWGMLSITKGEFYWNAERKAMWNVTKIPAMRRVGDKELHKWQKRRIRTIWLQLRCPCGGTRAFPSFVRKMELVGELRQTRCKWT